MRIISLLFIVSVLSACSFNAIEMAAEPTKQEFDLTDPENDGVISARDKCPESYAGAEVNHQGCASEKSIKVRRELLVNFETDSTEVNAAYYPEIKALADFMKTYPSVNVSIEGHTSILGNAAYNKKLSLRRAKAIKAILVNYNGIEASRINTIGYGFEHLLLEGNDEYIHAKNRRIVAEITATKKIIDMKWTIYSVDQRVE